MSLGTGTKQMRKRRIIMAAVVWTATGMASANPYIEPDPKIQRGAAEQLAKKFGGLRGTITLNDVPVQRNAEVDPISTQAIANPAATVATRAMTPGEWLRAKRDDEARATNAISGPDMDAVFVPPSISLPNDAPMIPLAHQGGKIRIVYANNAPI